METFGRREWAVWQDDKKVWHCKGVIGTYENGTRKYKEFKGQKRKDVIAKRDEYDKVHPCNIAVSNAENVDFGTYIKTWAAGVKKNQIKPASYGRLLSTIDIYIVPLIGHHQIGSLTADIIQSELINKLRDEPNKSTGNPNSYSTIKKVYDYTNACLKYAVRNGVIFRNPCDMVTMVQKKLLPPKEKRFLTDEEMVAFRDVCRSHRSKYGWALEFMMYTGLRKGEMLALKKECVHLDKKYIYICRTITKKFDSDAKNGKDFLQESTKSDKPRKVPLPDIAVELIRPYYNACPEGGFVVGGKHEFVQAQYFGRCYIAACKAAGIENPQGIHTLRHTYASKLFRAGADVKTVSELLGHSSVSFTYNTYIHLIEEQKTDAIMIFDNM